VFVGETESRKMSGAKAGTAMMDSKEEGEFAVVRDGGPKAVDRCWTTTRENTLRKRVMMELRELWARFGFDGDEEEKELEADAIAAGRGKDLEEKLDVLLDMVLVEDLDMLRRCMRKECEAHGWKAPDGSAGGETAAGLYFCGLCKSGCALDEEELRAMAAGKVACGEWNEEEQAERLESLGGGGCCGKEWSVGGTVYGEGVAVSA
jgi:hypothetical protein